MADDEPLFDQAMRGVLPLAGREEPRPRKRPARERATPPRSAVKPAFEIERWGERVEAVARGVDRGLLSALYRGEWPAERELDLHGLTESAAEQVVTATVTRALRCGERCLSIIHGRGLRSAAEPALKEAVVRWLSEPPLSGKVLVFATAPPQRGGAGATLVLLRKGRG